MQYDLVDFKNPQQKPKPKKEVILKEGPCQWRVCKVEERGPTQWVPEEHFRITFEIIDTQNNLDEMSRNFKNTPWWHKNMWIPMFEEAGKMDVYSKGSLSPEDIFPLSGKGQLKWETMVDRKDPTIENKIFMFYPFYSEAETSEQFPAPNFNEVTKASEQLYGKDNKDLKDFPDEDIPF